jgi:hypothetical protein
MDTNCIKIAISSLVQDAGEATRALELAKGLRENCPANTDFKIIFISHGSKFDRAFTDNGFELYGANPKLSGVGFMSDLKTRPTNMVGTEEMALDLLKGEIEALQDISPDVLIHGFWPVGGLASKLCNIKKEIGYIPIPFEREAYSTYLLNDIPDFLVPLTYLPKGFRVKIFNNIPKNMKLKNPMIKQTNILKAYEKIDYNGEKPKIGDLFDMLSADLTIINDFPDFYTGRNLPENFKVTGPLFSPSDKASEIDPWITEHFSSENKRLKIFCTLGSSGSKVHLLEAIKALTTRKDQNYYAVVLCPKAVCPIERAKAYADGFSNIFITDAFVPAFKINSMADIVLSHGGQGTVQTAVASGTPIIGFAVQPEQQVNLENVVSYGGAIRLPVNRWKAANIIKSIDKICANTKYKESMQKLRAAQKEIDGKKNSAIALWNFIGTGT